MGGAEIQEVSSGVLPLSETAFLDVEEALRQLAAEDLGNEPGDWDVAELLLPTLTTLP